jgi:hypothetical protein
MVIQVAVIEKIRPRAEAQSRWVSKGIALWVLSASQRLCVRTYSAPAGGLTHLLIYPFTHPLVYPSTHLLFYPSTLLEQRFLLDKRATYLYNSEQHRIS